MHEEARKTRVGMGRMARCEDSQMKIHLAAGMDEVSQHADARAFALRAVGQRNVAPGRRFDRNCVAPCTARLEYDARTCGRRRGHRPCFGLPRRNCCGICRGLCRWTRCSLRGGFVHSPIRQSRELAANLVHDIKRPRRGRRLGRPEEKYVQQQSRKQRKRRSEKCQGKRVQPLWRRLLHPVSLPPTLPPAARSNRRTPARYVCCSAEADAARHGRPERRNRSAAYHGIFMRLTKYGR